MDPHGEQYPGLPRGGSTANDDLRSARRSEQKWAQPDLNRRPPGYQPGAPAKLSYGPRHGGTIACL